MSGLIGARKTRLALLLCLSLGAAMPAQAEARAFLENTYTHKDGGANTQIANAAAFPDFRGETRDPSSLILPDVKAGSMRSVNMLVALGGESRPSFRMTVAPDIEVLSGSIDNQTETLHLSYDGSAAFGNLVLVRTQGTGLGIVSDAPAWHAFAPFPAMRRICWSRSISFRRKRARSCASCAAT